MSKYSNYYFISWVVVYSTGKTEYYNTTISITYKYPDEIVSEAEEYIENSYVYPNNLNEDSSREITLLSICKLD